MDELLYLMDNPCTILPNTIDATTSEMTKVFTEELPYRKIEKTYGFCYRWNPTFIQKCLIAKATDDFVGMSEAEREVWDFYVLWQDNNTLLYVDRSASLDKYFMDLLNCIEPDNCTLSDYTLVDVSPCPI